ncbi:MAG: sigma-70 family RNA polymerase sigma factor [Bacteroidota bacterium]
MFFRQKSQNLSDQELISKFRETQDLNLVSELFGRYTSMIYGVCVKYLKDRDDAKDAVMQVFEKLPTTLNGHEIANFKSWLYVTTRNHCLMQIRSKKANVAAAGKTTQELGPELMENDLILHLDEGPELENDLSKMEKCIQQLESQQQQCVRLFYLEEKCYKDVSTSTGFDLNKVKSYIQNGKRNLKICMERNE